MSDDLVERVARAMWMACDWGPMLKPYEEVREADKRVIRMEARAAIDVVLEEAAKVAETLSENELAMYHNDELNHVAEHTGYNIAAAIRAMKNA